MRRFFMRLTLAALAGIGMSLAGCDSAAPSSSKGNGPTNTPAKPTEPAKPAKLPADPG